MRWLATALIVIGLHHAVLAAPQVEIRAQTQLALDRVRLQPDGSVEILGHLSDKFTGEGIAGQAVTIRTPAGDLQARTDSDGKFRIVTTMPAGPLSVALEFPGANRLEAAELETTTDPTKAQVTLLLSAQDTPTGITVNVTSTIDDQPVELPVQLSAGAATDATLKLVKTIPTNRPATLTRAEAGGAGPRRIRAAFRGDDARQAAMVETTLELTTATTTTMTVTSTDLAFEDDLEVRGAVSDEAGNPVPRAAVALVSGDRRLAQSATDSAGKYKFELEAEILGQGQWGIGVQTEPSTAFVKPSRATPVVVSVAAPQPVPVFYTIAAFVATALAAGGFFLFRAKPWRTLRRRKAAPADAPLAAIAEDATVGGLVTNKPGVISTLRRASDDAFTGAVRDTVRGRPVPEALVRVTLGDVVREAHTSDDGSFAFEGMSAGDWRAEVVAPGHITELFAVAIPHRGELRGVRIDLVPVRERVFQLYRRAAEPALPEPRLWGIWSPRQIVDHVRAKAPSPAMTELTDFVEEVYFSPRLAPETVLPGASERVDRAIRERTPAA